MGAFANNLEKISKIKAFILMLKEGEEIKFPKRDLNLYQGARIQIQKTSKRRYNIETKLIKRIKDENKNDW